MHIEEKKCFGLKLSTYVKKYSSLLIATLKTWTKLLILVGGVVYPQLAAKHSLSLSGILERIERVKVR